VRQELLIAMQTFWKAELRVAVTHGSLLLDFVVPDMECYDVTTTDWK